MENIPKVTEIDVNPAIKKVSREKYGAAFIGSCVVILVLIGVIVRNNALNYTPSQYQAIEKERDQYKAANSILTESYGDLRINFWFKVDSAADVRAKEKINKYINLVDGNNTITINPKNPKQ